MISLESITRLRKIDLIAIVVLAVLWAIITTLINIPNTQLTFMISLLITVMFATFTALLVRKITAVILFYFIGSIITVSFNNLIEGYLKILILVIAGIVFELVIILGKKIKHSNIPFNLILAAGLSTASIPWTILLLVQSSKDLLPSVINLSLSSFLIGIIGSLLSYLIWYNIKGNKKVIKFEYSV